VRLSHPKTNAIGKNVAQDSVLAAEETPARTVALTASCIKKPARTARMVTSSAMTTCAAMTAGTA
jgi:hypothetical protein